MEVMLRSVGPEKTGREDKIEPRTKEIEEGGHTCENDFEMPKMGYGQTGVTRIQKCDRHVVLCVCSTKYYESVYCLLVSLRLRVPDR